MSVLLGIETSCDETAAAVVIDGREIVANVVASQIELHAQYGGVFPELASRAHVEAITPVVDEALAQAGLPLARMDAIAVTRGPGLVGSLLVGVNYAKAWRWAPACRCWASTTSRATSTRCGRACRASPTSPCCCSSSRVATPSCC